MKKVKLYCCDKYSVDDLGNVYSKSGKILKGSPGAVSAVIHRYKNKCKGCTFKWADGEMVDA